MSNVKISGLAIGDNNPVFVIAEAGVNHDGQLEKAMLLVDAAYDSGADCVKFQTFVAERVAVSSAPKAPYQRELTDPEESQVEMLKRLELSKAEFKRLMDYCTEKGILFLSTPYSIEDVDFLDALGVQAFKLASISIAEPLFLSYVASKGKPMIVSAGLATLAEIDTGIRAIRAAGNEQIILLQCTTNYPADPAEANLKVIPVLGEMLGVVTGYSDHTESQSCCLAATALGAKVIERHITLNRDDDGPDHAASSNPHEFRALVNAIRETESALGDGRKIPSPSELENLIPMRRSIVLRRPMANGDKIELDDIDFRRPGNGIRPDFAQLVIGRRLTCDIDSGVHLDWSMLSEG